LFRVIDRRLLFKNMPESDHHTLQNIPQVNSFQRRHGSPIHQF